jgi:hypothetical protein
MAYSQHALAKEQQLAGRVFFCSLPLTGNYFYYILSTTCEQGTYKMFGRGFPNCFLSLFCTDGGKIWDLTRARFMENRISSLLRKLPLQAVLALLILTRQLLRIEWGMTKRET